MKSFIVENCESNKISMLVSRCVGKLSVVGVLIIGMWRALYKIKAIFRIKITRNFKTPTRHAILLIDGRVNIELVMVLIFLIEVQQQQCVRIQAYLWKKTGKIKGVICIVGDVNFSGLFKVNIQSDTFSTIRCALAVVNAT